MKPAPFRPRKSLGQHFLRDPGVIRRIIGEARFRASDRILEVGPGRGELTLPLARGVRHVTAVEKDPRLAGVLEQRLSRAGITNVAVWNRDILDVDIGQMRAGHPDRIQVIGNLPYNISSPFLERLTLWGAAVGRAVLMFQLEVAKRITACPGNKDYGALTVLISLHALASTLFPVPAEAFRPKPKVESMVLVLDFEKARAEAPADDALFRKVVKGAFLHRRKTLVNSLTGSLPQWDRPCVLAALELCGIEPQRRAETLHTAEFLCLTRAFQLTDSKSDGI